MGMKNLYQNQRILTNNIKDISGWGYIETKCKYQSDRNNCRYVLNIATVPCERLSLQGLANCDSFRAPVNFRDVDIYNIAGEVATCKGLSQVDLLTF